MRRTLPRVLFCGALVASVVVSGLFAVHSVSADTAPRRIVNGWLPYWSMPESLAAVTGNSDVWNEASPFWYQATGATTVTRHTGAGDVNVINALRTRGVKVIPTVTESLDGTAMATLLRSATQRAAHVNTLVNLVTANGYDGIDLDYEAMNFGGTPTDKAAVRTGFVTLVRELNTALNARGRTLAVTVGPRTRDNDPNWAVFDYRGIAPQADVVRIMTYDYHWRNGAAGAVAPLAWVDTVIAYAVTAIPASKIEMGVPLYGYDWPRDTTQPDGWGTATSRTYAQAEALRAQYGATRVWSATDGAPYFTYSVGGVSHTVWYNDAESTRAKMTFIQRYGLRGLTFWAVGSEDAGQWPILRSYAIQRSVALTIAAPTDIVYGTTATIAGTLTTTSGAVVSGKQVVLQRRTAGSTTWTTVATGASSSTGGVSFPFAPGVNGAFRLHSTASWAHLPGYSAIVNTVVRWRVSGAFDDATVTRGTPAILRGSVAPVRAGTTVARQQLVNGTWRTVATAPVRADGTYSFTFTINTAGSYTYRIIAPPTSLNATGYGPNATVVVS